MIYKKGDLFMENKFYNNLVTVSGEIISDFRYNHEVRGEKFYQFNLSVGRLSDTCDIIPVTVSERLLDVTKSCLGKFAAITGQFRSFNLRGEEKNRLLLSVFARDIEILDELPDNIFANRITLEGYICKKPECRKTPLGREIADVLLAVNRPYCKADYIPCIMWGRNARFAETLEIGQKLKVVGRIQSREYNKLLGNSEYETRTAYEVSVSSVEVLEDEEDAKESN